MPGNPRWNHSALEGGIHYPILAITGHRHLTDPPAITDALRTVLANFPDTSLTLLSPLAEGADRLAAHEILRIPGGTLQAVLPLPADDYETDFLTPESRAEFHQLLAAAESILVLPPQPTRPEAYLAVGCHVVDTCDILLAVWDGLPASGIGGTAEIVTYARKLGKPLILIDAMQPRKITRERLPD